MHVYNVYSQMRLIVNLGSMLKNTLCFCYVTLQDNKQQISAKYIFKTKIALLTITYIPGRFFTNPLCAHTAYKHIGSWSIALGAHQQGLQMY